MRSPVAGLRARVARGERGYVAVVVAFTLTILLSFCAFAVDVGNWYYTGQRAQRAADAAALAGVTSLPANQAGAFTAAQSFSKQNSFDDANPRTVVTPSIDGRPTRLRVTVSHTVDNLFGWLMGRPTTTITKTAVADYSGPVPMGSPCNTFGNDPEPGSHRGSTCDNAAGQLWANVNGSKADKQNGDSYQSKGCNTSVTGRDGCTGSTNTEFDANGYFYTVNVQENMSSVTVQLYDPVWVHTGLSCDDTTAFGLGWGGTASTTAENQFVSATDASTRYASGASRDACTGDNIYGGSQPMNTTFTVRNPSESSWNPLTYPVRSGCQKTFAGYEGALFPVLDQYTSGTSPRSTYRPEIAEGFRRWVTLCTISPAPKGDYLIQVNSNLGGAFENANTGNRFSVRAFGDNNDKISVSGRERMGMFSNKPGETTEFYLARVPSGAAGQTLRVNLYDVGDSTVNGKIKIVNPSGGNYTGCVGSGVTTSIASDCSFTVTAGSPSVFNGRWQVVSIPIPASYTCNDTDNTACWVRLRYIYGTGSKPTDVTTWTASIEGDPVRLVE